MAFLSGLATEQANVSCTMAVIANLQLSLSYSKGIIYCLIWWFTEGCVFISSCHLWLIIGIWFCSFSIASLCLQAWRRSSLRRAPSSLDRRRGYLLIFWKLPNSLFTFILASSCKLVFSASYSKSNPLIPFFPPIWSWAHKAGEALGASWVFKFSSVLNCFCTLPLAASQAPAACWCLLP